MPLDTARTAFDWLVTGPAPVSIDGRLFPGLPPRRVPLNEVRDWLLHRRCPQATRDAVWAHLVLRSRTEGATWTVGCVGVALPALTRTAARLSARFAGDVTALSGCSASGVAGLYSPGMWFCGDLGQAAAGTLTTSFQAVNRVSISWR